MSYESSIFKWRRDPSGPQPRRLARQHVAAAVEGPAAEGRGPPFVDGMVVVWWMCGGCMVVVWWLYGGCMVVVWWY
jgi:hypothetical protein